MAFLSYIDYTRNSLYKKSTTIGAGNVLNNIANTYDESVGTKTSLTESENESLRSISLSDTYYIDATASGTLILEYELNFTDWHLGMCIGVLGLRSYLGSKIVIEEKTITGTVIRTATLQLPSTGYGQSNLPHAINVFYKSTADSLNSSDQTTFFKIKIYEGKTPEQHALYWENDFNSVSPNVQQKSIEVGKIWIGARMDIGVTALHTDGHKPKTNVNKSIAGSRYINEKPTPKTLKFKIGGNQLTKAKAFDDSYMIHKYVDVTSGGDYQNIRNFDETSRRTQSCIVSLISDEPNLDIITTYSDSSQQFLSDSFVYYGANINSTGIKKITANKYEYSATIEENL